MTAVSEQPAAAASRFDPTPVDLFGLKLDPVDLNGAVADPRVDR